ncbi:unnamed protein product [Staurois parvus]|uniref:Uncharacterized protein n=1 Tax=Staurois parvus TaxID=386267 RepID=A0ABN9H525_9NEOB|nr:unnamed protein product [Staurois parvus]
MEIWTWHQSSQGCCGSFLQHTPGLCLQISNWSSGSGFGRCFGEKPSRLLVWTRASAIQPQGNGPGTIGCYGCHSWESNPRSNG